MQLGIDKRVRDNLLVGDMVSYSKGNIDYVQIADKGKYKHKITSVHPYLAWSDNGVSLWGSYGTGKLEIKRETGTSNTDTPAYCRVALKSGYQHKD